LYLYPTLNILNYAAQPYSCILIDARHLFGWSEADKFEWRIDRNDACVMGAVVRRKRGCGHCSRSNRCPARGEASRSVHRRYFVPDGSAIVAAHGSDLPVHTPLLLPQFSLPPPNLYRV
jgi:hypothetical protein